MFDVIFGIPVHPLVVHAVVVLAPLTAVMLVAFAVSARFRAWSGILTPVVATVTLVLSPVATQSGEALEKRVGRSDLVEEHAEMGDVLPYVMLAATVMAWALWFVWRRTRATVAAAGDAADGTVATGTSGLFRILAVVGILAAVGLAVDVTLIGHSGAKAVWSDAGSKTPAPGGGDDD